VTLVDELIVRLETVDNVEQVVSDVLRGFAEGELTTADVSRITRVMDRLIRGEDKRIRAGETALRALLTSAPK
jgi:hypothetical protein